MTKFICSSVWQQQIKKYKPVLIGFKMFVRHFFFQILHFIARPTKLAFCTVLGIMGNVVKISQASYSTNMKFQHVFLWTLLTYKNFNWCFEKCQKSFLSANSNKIEVLEKRLHLVLKTKCSLCGQVYFNFSQQNYFKYCKSKQCFNLNIFYVQLIKTDSI